MHSIASRRGDVVVRTAMIMVLGLLASACSQDAPNESAAAAPAEATASAVDARAMDAAGIRARVERIDGEAIMAADETPGDWIAHGRTYDEQRHSPLTQISTENVSELGLARYADLGTTRGLESTPIVVDGVMFNSVPGPRCSRTTRAPAS